MNDTQKLKLENKRLAEAKHRALADLERKRLADEAARRAAHTEKIRLDKERQRVKKEQERAQRMKAEKRAAAKRLQAERIAKMQTAKKRAERDATHRGTQRGQTLHAQLIQNATQDRVVVYTNNADLKREAQRDSLRQSRQRQHGLRGWSPSRHRRHVTGSKWHPRYWGAGVFYYNADTSDVTVIEHNTTIINEASL